jgi:hypothetical protein
MNYSLNLKEELISETNKAGKKVKKTFLVEGFSPTEKFRRKTAKSVIESSRVGWIVCLLSGSVESVMPKGSSFSLAVLNGFFSL